MSCSAPMKIEMYVGNTHAVRYTIKDQDNLPLDMTDGTCELIVMDNAGAVLVTIVGMVWDAVNGIVVFEFAPGDTGGIDPGTYKYTANVTNGDGRVYTIAALGKLVLLPVE